MLSRLIFMAVLLPTLAVGAQAESELGRFRMVSAERTNRLERELRSAGAAGYRFLGAAQGVSVNGKVRISALLERSTAGKSFDYAVRTCTGDLNDEAIASEVGRLAGEGYRLASRGVVVRRVEDFWLPVEAYDDQMVLILERSSVAREASEGGPPHEYASLGFGKYETFYSDLEEKRREGYEILGLWNSGRLLRVLLEKNDASTPPSASTSSFDYRLLIMATRKVAKSWLKRSAQDGYRVLAADDPSITGPPYLLLEKSPSSEDPLDYRFLTDVPKKLRKNKLERKLNKKTRKGWRVSPTGLTQSIVTLERESKKDPPAAYLALTSSRAGLSRGLEEAVERGYRFLALYVEAGETTVLLEKPPDSTAVSSAEAMLPRR